MIRDGMLPSAAAWTMEDRRTGDAAAPRQRLTPQPEDPEQPDDGTTVFLLVACTWMLGRLSK